MKRNFAVIVLICTIINIYIFLPIATAFITHKFSLDWVERSGQMGDTFGGLFSPVIGGISIYLIYRTYQAQRKQLKDQKQANKTQKEQAQISRITDIIYLQLEKINERISNESFNFSDNLESKIGGRSGLNQINKLLDPNSQKNLYKSGNVTEKVTESIVKNLNQLIEIHESIANATVIADNLLIDYNLEVTNEQYLRGLLVLNLGNIVTSNIYHMSDFINKFNENITEIDSKYPTVIQIDELRQYVKLTKDFCEKSRNPVDR